MGSGRAGWEGIVAMGCVRGVGLGRVGELVDARWVCNRFVMRLQDGLRLVPCSTLGFFF